MEFPKGLFETSTVTGRRVIIYNISAGGDRPIHGAYLADKTTDEWIQCSWGANGRFRENARTSLDIFLEPNNVV